MSIGAFKLNAISKAAAAAAPSTFDIGGLTSVSTFTTGLTGNNIGMTFNSDGTRMFIGNNASTIRQYNLSTAWSISTASSSGNNLSTPHTFCQGLALNSTGTRLYSADDDGRQLRTFTLSTANSLSGASFLSGRVVTSSTSTVSGLWMGNSNNTMVYQVPGYGLYRITLSSPSSLTTITQSEATDPEYASISCFLSPDGLKLFLTRQSEQVIDQYTLSSAYAISTLSLTKSTTISGSQLRALHFKSDGSKLFVLRINGTVTEFSVG